MKKHKDIVVKGSIILNQWDNDNITASEHAGVNIEPNKEYLVQWPDHVTTPIYNGDCTILHSSGVSWTQ